MRPRSTPLSLEAQTLREAPTSGTRSPSMLSSSPASCTSPNPDKENPSKKVRWAFARRRTSSTDSESKSQSDPVRPRSRKPSRLTVKYDRGQLQRWVEMEQWVDTQVQELFQVGRTWQAWGLEGTREVLYGEEAFPTGEAWVCSPETGLPLVWALPPTL
uniref:Protein phosphatase 1 regulatory inhibitor subunit 14D n=2 Tax=Ovis aries TaxID=9940 RepID=A0AC11CU48_SHEEP